MKTRSLLGLLGVASSLVLGGCDALPKQELQRTETDVRSIGVVRLSLGQPILLDKKMRDAIKPDFALTSDDALKMSVPTSAAALRYTLDAMVASLRVAGPGRTDTTKNTASSIQTATSDSATKADTSASGTQQNTASQSSAANTSTTNKTESEKGRSVGDASKVTAPSANSPKEAAHISTPPDIASIGLGIDPTLRYLNAMSLLMAVRTLNQTIDRIKAPEGWDAYIVPVRISLSPQGRGLPYEMRSTLVFSGVEDAMTGPKVVAKAGEPAARIIPIATDNHDVMSRNAADDVARSFGLGIGFVAGLTGVSADVGKQSQNSNTFRANDIHSVMTAGQAGENALDVRFGAMRIAEDAYTAVERTHIVVVVVMVPKGSKAIMATASNSFVHTTKGIVVDKIDTSGVARRLYNILSTYQIDIGKTVCTCGAIMEVGRKEECAKKFDEIKVLADEADKKGEQFAVTEKILGNVGQDALRRVQQLVQYGRMTSLRTCVGFDNRANADYALVNLVGSVVGTLDESRYSKAIAMLPQGDLPKKAKSLPVQTVLLKDDEATVSTQLRGGENLSSADTIQAYILVNNLRISATSVRLDGEDGLMLSFPSLKGFVKTGAKTKFKVELKVDDSSLTHEALYHLAPAKPPNKGANDINPKG